MNTDVLELRCRPRERDPRTPDALARPRERGVPTAAPEAVHEAGGGIEMQPDSRRFIAMLEAYRPTGGLAPGNFLAQSLQEHRCGDLAHLARLIVDRRVFVLDWRGESWIPMFQFDSGDLSCKPGPALVRAELTGLASGWAVATWFTRPNALLDGHLPVNVVDSDLDAVLGAARSFAPASEPSRDAHADA